MAGYLIKMKDFLSHLDQEDRKRLEPVGEVIHLAEGQFLMRRGEQDRDIYRIERGTLEVTDTRFHPGIILKALGKGEVVGELGFIAGIPRSADVIAGSGCVVRRWPAEALDRFIQADQGFATRFWKAVAIEVTQRLVGANTMGLGNASLASPSEDPLAEGSVATLVRETARTCRDGLASLDGLLRRDPQDNRARDQLFALLVDLQASMERLAAECGTWKALSSSSKVIARELLPYLRQAATARLALEHKEGVGGTAVGQHLAQNTPSGDSPLGQAIDQWLLSLPFARGVRSRQQGAFEELRRALPPVGPVRVMLVHSGGGQLARLVFSLLVRRQGVLVSVERSREGLEAFARETEVPDYPLRVQYILDPLNDLPPGRSLQTFQDQHVILVDSLLDYLPARVSTESLASFASILAPRGQLIATALTSSNDSVFWEHLLEWPTIHRSPRSLTDIVHAAGFGTVTLSLTSGAGSIVVARDVAASHR